MATREHLKPHWRAVGPYVGTNASKAGLLDETRRFLLSYAQTGSFAATRQALLTSGLHQQSRSTRETITLIIQQRLGRWNPPPWVLADLVAFATDTRPAPLKAALLLHTVRQDTLLYDVVQKLLVSRWQEEEAFVIRSDVQGLLDAAYPDHPEIDRWSHATRAKLSGNMLTILRDYGLLQGAGKKRIVEPVVPEEVAAHLVRLLQAEGITAGERAYHPDWRIWLWSPDQAQATINRVLVHKEVP